MVLRGLEVQKRRSYVSKPPEDTEETLYYDPENLDESDNWNSRKKYNQKVY
jgi:hypothetical protein